MKCGLLFFCLLKQVNNQSTKGQTKGEDLVCLAISAFDGLAGSVANTLNYTSEACANGFLPRFKTSTGHTKHQGFDNLILVGGMLWLEGFLRFEPRVVKSQPKARDRGQGVL